MSYQIPADLEQRIQAQIATGQFASEEEVLREAIGTLEQRQRNLAELQEMIRVADDDIAAGRIGLIDVEATKAAVRQRLLEHGCRD